MWKRKAGSGGDASFSVAGKDKVDGEENLRGKVDWKSEGVC